MRVRAGWGDDRERFQEIQKLSPEAAQWDASEYLVLVAEREEHVVGALVWHFTAPDEREILNLAVHPGFRRRGVGLALLTALLADAAGHSISLEVREGNEAARALYRKAGFAEVGRRPGYYRQPPEAAIVMKVQS